MKNREQAGFSTMECLIALAIFAGLAGVVVPIVSQESYDAMKEEALADIDQIATAVNGYIRDTMFYPTGIKGVTRYHFLYTEGEIPANNPLASGPGMPLADLLNSREFGGSDWKGPYLESMGADPWGNAYLINAQGYFNRTERTIILSAGPNGVIDTPVTSTYGCEDDIFLLLD